MKCKCGGWRFVTLNNKGERVKKCIACKTEVPLHGALDILPPELHEEYLRRKELEGKLI